MTDKVHKAKCFCGKVEFEATGDPKFRSMCHCLICQRLSGGECQALVGFPGYDTLKVTKGEDGLTKLASSASMDRYFCSTCGSSVYNVSKFEQNKFKDAPAVLFEDFAAVSPTAHIFYSRRRRDYNDDFPKFDEYPIPGSLQLTNDGKPIPAAKKAKTTE